MKYFIQRELSKRLTARLQRQRSDRNWPIHKAMIARELDDFNEAVKPELRYLIADSLISEKARKRSGQSYWVGNDSLTMRQSDRLTARADFDFTEGGVTQRKYFELGASITIHYTFVEGLIQVFFGPPCHEENKLARMDVLIWVGRNTDDLTPRFIRKLLKKFLVFSRVESPFEVSSLYERSAVRWWRFLDVRNRRQILEKTNTLLNPWGIVVWGAALAVLNLIIGLIQIYK